MASNSYFQFKQFVVNQEDCAMKVGTDGVLLGAWFDFKENGSVLDIGTGTGLIALMAAQRGADSVVAVEIDEKAARQAAENVASSKWKDIVTVVHSDIACFSDDKRFDAVVCNPPFFRDSLRSPDSVRSQARHNDTLSYEKLAEVVNCLLSDSGLFSLVLPYDMADTFISVAAKNGLYLCKRTNVVTRKGNLPKRVLLSLCKQVKVCVTDELVMFDELNNETSEYISIVRDFYLKY
jgi:tRNA1Val (adenine37-N6)-methyltransferase